MRRVRSPRRKLDPYVPERKGADTVVRVPERMPSAGLAWSMRMHPEQYAPAFPDG